MDGIVRSQGPPPMQLSGNQADYGQPPVPQQYNSRAGPSNSNVPFTAREVAVQVATSVEYQRRNLRITPGVSDRISKERAAKSFKPLGFWDSEKFRRLTIEYMRSMGQMNPTEGQIRGLMHELREVPPHNLPTIFHGR